MILVITATEKELSALKLSENIATHVCGIGSAMAGVECAYAIAKYKPSMVILAGIAGRYAHSELKIGDAVLVQSEFSADTGAYFGDEFKARLGQEFLCPYVQSEWGFKSVKSYTVNVCAAPFLTSNTSADIENMEGVAFFAACLKYKVPFLEIRTISNTVSPLRDDWNIDLALENLNAELEKLIAKITHLT